MLLGLILIVAGVTLALAGGFANWLRFVPYRSDAKPLAGYRVAGSCISAAGLAIAVALG